MSRRSAVSADRSASRNSLSAATTHAAVEARINGLEVTSEVVDMILAQPDLAEHLEVVLLYLEMDLIEWQSVLTLREGPGDHMRRFLHVHDSILTRPPHLLFLLVKKLWSLFEHERQWAVAQIKIQTSQMHPGSSRLTRQASPSGGRTAPHGQSYRCPARGCNRSFVKLGHAENHVRKRHHEYLELHPDYRPEHHLISRPPSKSPQMERKTSDSGSTAQLDIVPPSDKPRGSSRMVSLGPGPAHSEPGDSPASSVQLQLPLVPLLSQPRRSLTRSSSHSQHSSGNSSNNLDESVLRQISMMQPQTLSGVISGRHDVDTALFESYEQTVHDHPDIQERRHERR